MKTPTIPAGQVHAARVSATCDGEQLVTVLTDDGPEASSCPGCRSCRPPRDARTAEQNAARRAAALAAVFASSSDDEGAF